MLNLPTRIYFCTVPTDMRKSFDGLLRMTEVYLQQNVLDGGLFVFLNKKQDRIKLLYWDHDGLAIWYKRLEAGTYQRLSSPEGIHGLQLSSTDLALLLQGIDLTSVQRRKRYQISEKASTS
ncbi:IS66 family insertion sequence element accessory protein TnpB [Gimesia algae]|uniref:IS66 Orf2 like protein n=1 Tax=Gimesia algae TaxID=2527971 RepID=A0A517VB26_9PLAN|nr:IS66 family insertion sequence element accessory protein TnpB [Gimesia algae]QDT90213.1 IS66 Orf2 like protein [Gimesia algae]QDT91172.1 IS66 Orf2 like protein [Gimesia algae]QDT91494.1 IS66 Orf2 like protein [Gimesia algae]